MKLGFYHYLLPFIFHTESVEIIIIIVRTVEKTSLTEYTFFAFESLQSVGSNGDTLVRLGHRITTESPLFINIRQFLMRSIVELTVDFVPNHGNITKNSHCPNR